MIDLERVVKFSSISFESLKNISESVVANMEVTWDSDYINESFDSASLSLFEFFLDLVKDDTSVLVLFLPCFNVDVLAVGIDSMLM